MTPALIEITRLSKSSNKSQKPSQVHLKNDIKICISTVYRVPCACKLDRAHIFNAMNCVRVAVDGS